MQQRLIDVGLLGLGVYFAVQLLRGLGGYLRYRAVASTAVVTWPAPSPAQYPLLVALGAAGAVLAALNAAMRRPLHHVVALLLMAVYFLGLVPIARRIRLGLYRDGVWAHRGFLAWSRVGRIAFVEEPQIVLLLTHRRTGAPFKLPVPATEYGTVRKVLEEKAREGLLKLDPAILGI